MEQTKSFKTRVKEAANNNAKLFQENFIEKQYLIYSNKFKKNKQYILSSTRANYKHLIGVNSSLNANEFFVKCINKELTEEDFDFSVSYRDERIVRGTVRRKISVIKEICSLIQPGSLVEEAFCKNKVSCNIAAANSKATLAFVGGKKCRAASLMKGNELSDAAVEPDLILVKKTEEEKFGRFIVGNLEILKKYCLNGGEYNLISDKLLRRLNLKEEEKAICI